MNSRTKLGLAMVLGAVGVACSPEGLGSTTSPLLVGPNARGCFDPADRKAVPDDGLSDRVAMQAAMDDAAAWTAAGNGPATVCIGAGTWDCDRALPGSYNRFACLSTHAHDLTIAGVGPATVIRLAGDQHNATVSVLSVDASAERVAIQDLTIYTPTFDTDEQTYAITTSGICSATLGTCRPIRDLAVRRFTCNHPPSTDGTRKGDCIRLLGDTPPSQGVPGTNVYGVTIEDNAFQACARSGIQPQRGVHDVVIRRNQFHCDQPIHGEATGGTQEGENTAIEVTDNDFHADPSMPSDYDILLSGTGGAYDGIHIHHNRLSRGIDLYRTANAEVDHESIAVVAKGAAGTIEVGNICSGLSIHDVSIDRSGAAGPLLRLTPHSGGICGGATIANNVLTQRSTSFGIYTESVSDTTIAGNTLAWPAPAPEHAAIYARATVSPVTNLSLAGNRISGSLKSAVFLGASPFAVGPGVAITDNSATGPATGLSCSGAGGFAAIVAFGNALGPTVCPGVTFIGGQGP